jgi:hypothetical protein
MLQYDNFDLRDPIGPLPYPALFMNGTPGLPFPLRGGLVQDSE